LPNCVLGLARLFDLDENGWLERRMAEGEISTTFPSLVFGPDKRGGPGTGATALGR